MLGVYTSITKTYVVICGQKKVSAKFAKRFMLPDSIANNADIAAVYVRKHLSADFLILACLPAESLDFIPEIKGLSLMPIGGNMFDLGLDPEKADKDGEELWFSEEEEELTPEEEDTVDSMRKAVGNDSPPDFEVIRKRIQEDPNDEVESEDAEG